VLVPSAAFGRAEVLLGSTPGVRLVEMASEDGTWLRDQAPLFVQQQDVSGGGGGGSGGGGARTVGVCWDFNNWGRMMGDHFELDAQIR